MRDGMRVYDEHIEAWRGAAINYWQASADGVYLFNAYRNPNKGGSRTVGAVPLTQVLGELGDVGILRRKTTLYCVDMDMGKRGGYNCGDIRYYMPRERLVPVALNKEGSTVQFDVGEELAVSDAVHENAHKVQLRLRVVDLGGQQAPLFLFNGEALPAVPSGEWMEYDLRPSQVRLGANTLTGRLPSTFRQLQDTVPRLTHVELWVHRTSER